jgi:hypothetical protein
MYIVVATYCETDQDGDTIQPREMRDEWIAEESYEEAEAFYNSIIKEPNIYSASICAVIKSTDYEGVE